MLRLLTKRSPQAAARGRARLSHLFLTIRDTVYLVDRIACDPSTETRAFRLSKRDGTLYDVAETIFGPECDCPDFVYRRDGLDPDGCKHVRALVDHGLIGPAGALAGASGGR
jgi:hypothetical protein